jgi:hypothetical protein
MEKKNSNPKNKCLKPQIFICFLKLGILGRDWTMEEEPAVDNKSAFRVDLI